MSQVWQILRVQSSVNVLEIGCHNDRTVRKEKLKIVIEEAVTYNARHLCISHAISCNASVVCKGQIAPYIPSVDLLASDQRLILKRFRSLKKSLISASLPMLQLRSGLQFTIAAAIMQM